jgi:hypothetical protein
MGSEQVATVLRQSGAHVRLIVARSISEPTEAAPPHAPIVPTHQLDEHLRNLNEMIQALMQNTYTEGEQQQMEADYLAQVQQVGEVWYLINHLGNITYTNCTLNF